MSCKSQAGRLGSIEFLSLHAGLSLPLLLLTLAAYLAGFVHSRCVLAMASSIAATAGRVVGVGKVSLAFHKQPRRAERFRCRLKVGRESSPPSRESS